MNMLAIWRSDLMIVFFVVLIGILSPTAVDGQVFASLACQPNGTTSVDLEWTLVDPANPPSMIEITNSNSPLSAVAPGTATNASIPGNYSVDIICITAFDAANNPIETMCCGGCAVQDLSCTPPAGGPGSTFLQWTNSGNYSAINISVNGQLAQTLAGNATSVTIAGLDPGCNTLCVTPQVGGNDCPETCCEAWGGALPCVPILSCTETSNSTVAITWNPSWTCNGVGYFCTNFQQVTISVESILGTNNYLLNPFASSFRLTGLDLGNYAYTICLEVVGMADEYCCTVGCILCPVPKNPDDVEYRRGDPTDDGTVDLGDVIKTLGYLFLNASVECTRSADVNDDGGVDVSDVITLLTYLFLDGPEPAPPFSECGVDETEDELDCEQSTSCI